ncbi:TPA: ankyrin repeat domain-containing protein [Legionella anisa]
MLKGDILKTHFLLTSDKINPNKADSEGNSPLMYAIEQNNVALVKLLINDRRVNLNARNKNGKSPFDLALTKDNPILVELLRSKEAERGEATNSANTTSRMKQEFERMKELDTPTPDPNYKL